MGRCSTCHEDMRTCECPDVLRDARDLIYGDRAIQYGPVRENFKRIADMWSAYFNMTIRIEDVAMAMIMVKVARAANATANEQDADLPRVLRDTIVDIAGYAGCVEKAWNRK